MQKLHQKEDAVKNYKNNQIVIDKKEHTGKKHTRKKHTRKNIHN